MPEIEVIKLTEYNKWNKIVTSFSNYDVYYLADYVKAFELNQDGEGELIYYKSDSGRAMQVVIKREVNSTLIPCGEKWYDYTTPYGYGGFLVEDLSQNEGMNEFIDKYEVYCKDNNIICEFIRFHPVLENVKRLDGYLNIKNLGNTVSIDLSSEEVIWNNLSSKNRNVIRKAQKNGVKIYWGRDKELLQEFKKMYCETMKRDQADEYYYFSNEFYDCLLNDLKYNALIFYAVYNNEKIAMSFIIFANTHLHYHLSASKKEFSNLAATNLLLYEVALWGYHNNFHDFHLGGGLGAREDSLYKFKKAFNRYDDKSFYLGNKIYDYVKYNKICEEYKVDLDTEYFPAYRNGARK